MRIGTSATDYNTTKTFVLASEDLDIFFIIELAHAIRGTFEARREGR